jgi:hypothetical protein
MTSLTQQTIRAIATGFAGLAGAAVVVGLLLVAAGATTGTANAMGAGYAWNQPGPTTAGVGAKNSDRRPILAAHGNVIQSTGTTAKAAAVRMATQR